MAHCFQPGEIGLSAFRRRSADGDKHHAGRTHSHRHVGRKRQTLVPVAGQQLRQKLFMNDCFPGLQAPRFSPCRYQRKLHHARFRPGTRRQPVRRSLILQLKSSSLLALGSFPDMNEIVMLFQRNNSFAAKSLAGICFSSPAHHIIRILLRALARCLQIRQ